MKLFYKPGACSLASHIILNEVESTFDIERVDTAAGTTEAGQDYIKINPKGYVPTLELNDGTRLNESASVLQYLADTNPKADLAPPMGTVARARLQEHLNYTASELHKAFKPLFSDTASDQDKEKASVTVAEKMDYLETQIGNENPYLLGDKFSVADAYAFVVCNWTNFVGIDLKTWPNVAAYVERIAARPSAQKAMKAEGLLG